MAYSVLFGYASDAFGARKGPMGEMFIERRVYSKGGADQMT